MYDKWRVGLFFGKFVMTAVMALISGVKVRASKEDSAVPLLLHLHGDGASPAWRGYNKYEITLSQTMNTPRPSDAWPRV